MRSLNYIFLKIIFRIIKYYGFIAHIVQNILCKRKIKYYKILKCYEIEMELEIK